MKPTLTILLALLCAALGPAGLRAADLPVLPDGTWECHGTATLRGQDKPERFWLRLLPPDPAFAGNRMLQVVYTPPPPAALGGTHLADAPFLLLDASARLVAWNDRAGSSSVTPGTAGAVYVATRDRTVDDRLEVKEDRKRIAGERGWDRSAAPLLLALVWRAAGRAQVPCVDLFGDQPDSAVAWNGPEVALAGTALHVEADGAGRLKTLLDAQGNPLVTVTAWLKEGR